MRVVVISTGYRAPTKELCIASVKAQLMEGDEHVYVEASEQNPPRGQMQNQYEALMALPDDVIAVMVDGDDELVPGALERVRVMHAAGAWVTYGSYRYADGRPGYIHRYVSGADYRIDTWSAGHLKTFRAGLVKLIRPEDVRKGDDWLPLAPDVALMMPMLELAGQHVAFCSEVLYVYHLETSFEWGANRQELEQEKACEMHVRSLAKYAPLERLPWS
jgi:hypothetical protein